MLLFKTVNIVIIKGALEEKVILRKCLENHDVYLPTGTRLTKIRSSKGSCGRRPESTFESFPDKDTEVQRTKGSGLGQNGQ